VNDIGQVELLRRLCRVAAQKIIEVELFLRLRLRLGFLLEVEVKLWLLRRGDTRALLLLARCLRLRTVFI